MRFSIKVFSGLVIFLVCASALPWSAPPARAQAQTPVAFYQQGKAALEAKDYEQAIALLKQAVALDGKNVEYQTVLADAHFVLGQKLGSLNQWDEAIREYEAAYAINTIHRRRDAALNLTRIGGAYDNLRQYDQALKYYAQALPILRELQERGGEAVTLIQIGGAYASLRQYDQALKYYAQALLILREFLDDKGKADILAKIGAAHAKLSQYEQALDHYKQALAIFRAVQERKGEATTLNNIGSAYGSLSQYEKALEYFEQALRIARELQESEGEAATLNNIGGAYSSLSQHEQALDHYKQALAIFRAVQERKGEATTLNNIGLVYQQLNQYEKALEYYEQALVIFRQVDYPQDEAATLNNIGGAYQNVNQYEKALEYYAQALAIRREVKDRQGEAVTLNNIGSAYQSLSQYEKALEYYNQALRLSQEIKDRSGEARTLGNLMWAWGEQNQPALAIFYGKQSVNVYQSIRGEIRGLDKEIQQGYLQSNEDIYRQLADLLIAQGRIPEAEQVLAMLKEEELSNFVQRGDKIAGTLLQTVAPNSREEKFLKEYDVIAEQVTRLGTEYSQLEDERQKTPPDQPFAGQARLDEINQALSAAKKSFELFLSGLKIEFDRNDARLKEVESGLQKDLLKWNAPDVVVISTVTGKDRLSVFITTQRTQRAHQMDISAEELNTLIGKFREAVSDKTARLDPRPSGQKLYDLLIKPLEGDLAGAGAKTILWSLDGALRYVPIAALYDKEKGYLAEHYASAVITLASRTNLGRENAADQDDTILALGVSKEYENFAALTAVPQELHGIVREAGETTGVLGGKRLLDEQFDMAAFKNYMGRYPLVHIASHFNLKPGKENDSFLLLGGGVQRELTLADLREMNTIFGGVKLLVLSACETAQGGTGSGGEEIEGFGMIAQEQGAQTVLATLWPVADTSTRDLMVNFYQTLETKGATDKAEALRKAQLALLHGEVGNLSPDDEKARGTRISRAPALLTSQPRFAYDKNKPYAHPYFWAPFILIGNWR